jgi:hypothetical protein
VITESEWDGIYLLFDGAVHSSECISSKGRVLVGTTCGKKRLLPDNVKLPRYLPGWSEENNETPLVRGLNPELSECESVQATRDCCI